jgi:hypothetical protein
MMDVCAYDPVKHKMAAFVTLLPTNYLLSVGNNAGHVMPKHLHVFVTVWHSGPNPSTVSCKAPEAFPKAHVTSAITTPTVAYAKPFIVPMAKICGVAEFTACHVGLRD